MRVTAKWRIFAALCATLSCWACARSESSDEHRKEASTPAGQVGKVAYEAAKESGKLAKGVAKEAAKAAHEAHEGWKDAAAKDKSKQ